MLYLIALKILGGVFLALLVYVIFVCPKLK